MLKNKKIVLGISGGIAVYKICTLVNLLLKEGAEVRIVMTEAATKFVSPLTFQTLSNNKVYVDMFDYGNYDDIKHISLAKWADLVIVAPATANTIGKIAHGLADNLLSTLIIAMPEKTKVLIAPAMNTNMWKNEITQQNVEVLKKLKGKYIFLGPGSGMLACRDKGTGKIIDNDSIVKAVKDCLK